MLFLPNYLKNTELRFHYALCAWVANAFSRIEWRLESEKENHRKSYQCLRLVCESSCNSNKAWSNLDIDIIFVSVAENFFFSSVNIQ